MAPEQEKRRSIADFFSQNKKRASTFAPQSTVPQKRPSPKPVAKTEDSSSQKNGPNTPTTPSKKRVRQQVSTPVKSPCSPRAALRQTTLSFRSPAPTNSHPSTPSGVRPALRDVDEEIKAELAAEKQFSPGRSPTAKFSSVLKAKSSVGSGAVVVVRDSEDDTESLLSLDELIGFGKKKDADTDLSSPVDGDEEAAREKDRLKMLSLFLHPPPAERPGVQRLRDLEAEERSRNFNITKYLDTEAELRQRDESLQETRRRYEASKAQLEAERSGNASELLLQSLMADDGKDEDDVARLMSAVSRTEALSTEKTFSFFAASDASHKRDVPTYPEADIPMKLWLPGDDDTRSRMFLSGFIAELAAAGRLSDAALAWTFQAVVAEPDPYVRSAYMECLKGGSSWWTRTNLGATDVLQCFQSLGASAEDIKSGSAIRPRHHPLSSNHNKGLTGHQPATAALLSDILDLFEELCLHMDFLALSTLASITCRLAVDVNLMACNWLHVRVESLLTALLDLPEKEARVFVAEHILEDMSKSLHDPGLQSVLLTHILPTSATASQLRIRLAHNFLLGRHDKTDAAGPFSTPFPVNLALLMEHIRTDASFNTAQPTKLDFTALHERTAILDTAISDGGRSSVCRSDADADADAKFNKSIDALAAAVKDTFVRISDSGASHMSRTEAKDALQCLYYRLLYAVRTAPQPKRNIFDPRSGRLRDGAEYRDEARRQEFMQSFLSAYTSGKRVRKGPPSSPPLLPQLPPSQEGLSETERAIRRQLELSSQ